jgi:hypothetical protein
MSLGSNYGRSCFLVISLGWFLGTPTLNAASADVICKTSSGTLVLRRSCRATERRVDIARLGAVGPSGPTGSKGTDGASGADGALRIYGDGSAGALDVASNTTLNATNNQYTSITIESGKTLDVASGAVLRSLGDCVIHGAIVVEPGAQGGRRGGDPAANVLTGAVQEAGAGYTSGTPQAGTVGDPSQLLFSTYSCAGIGSAAARALLRPGMYGGSGGAAGNIAAITAGQGGGSIVILCQGNLSFEAGSSINADGTTPGAFLGAGGAGGGAGGVIIAASRGSLSTAAGSTFSANGGDGLIANNDSAAGGGGAGGLVHFIAPTLTLNGTVNVDGGAGGTDVTLITSTTAISGGAGGCAVGPGGLGGQVNATRPTAGGARQWWKRGTDTLNNCRSDDADLVAGPNGS